MKFFFLFLALALNAGANVLLKVGSKIGERHPLGAGASLTQKGLHFLNAPTVIGIFLFAVNVLAYRRALDEFNLNVAYPIMVTGGMVLVATAAWMLPILDEKLTWVQFAGIALVVAGIWLLCARPAGAIAP